MSQRKALIASLVITLVLALSAVGIRAAFFDSPDASADPESGVTLVVPGSGGYEDDDRYDESDDDEEEDTSITNDHDEQDDHNDSGDSDHEEDHEDDEP